MGAGASSDSHSTPLHPDLAAQKKEQGNQHHQTEQYAEAILAYSEAISLVNLPENSSKNAPNTVSILWCNRSASRIKFGANEVGSALSDALVAISLHPRWFKPYYRAGQAAFLLQQYQLAREYLIRAQILTNNNDATINELLEQAKTKRPVGLQDGPGSLMSWGELHSMPDRPKVVNELRGKFVTEVAAGAMHTLALTPHGVYAWGSNEQGQLGIGISSEGNSPVMSPQLIPSLLGIKIYTVSCGVGHSCAIDQSGILWTWGIGGQGQLGLGQLIRCVPTPTAVVSFKEENQRVRAVSCGIAHTFVVTTHTVTEQSNVFAFGWNQAGQLGLGTDLNLSTEQLTSSTLQPPRSEDTVASPTLVNIFAKGDNNDNDNKEKDNDENDENEDEVQQICCGGAHTVVVTAQGRLYTTGSGSCGQLGLNEVGSGVIVSTRPADCGRNGGNGADGNSGTNGTNGNNGIGAVSTFQLVDSKYFGNRKVAFACAGEEFTCFVTKGDQEVFACGLGNAGQLGDGNSNNQSIPTQVQGMSGLNTVR